MADLNLPKMTDLSNAIRKTLSAHRAVLEGIATHAERHRAALEAARHEAEQQAKIKEGIKRQNAQLHATGV